MSIVGTPPTTGPYHMTQQENEKSKDILIDYNLHKLLIGTQGARIREIREKFNQVNDGVVNNH